MNHGSSTSADTLLLLTTKLKSKGFNSIGMIIINLVPSQPIIRTNKTDHIRLGMRMEDLRLLLLTLITSFMVTIQCFTVHLASIHVNMIKESLSLIH